MYLLHFLGLVILPCSVNISNSSIEADDCDSQQTYLWHRGDYGQLSDALFRVD